ncbi:hypothetical protein CPB84DRAFT_1692151, partial [Gymnopilus junonius]
QTGVRWSELARLLYFDMFTVSLSTLCTIFSCLIKEHFTGILGIGHKSTSEKPLSKIWQDIEQLLTPSWIASVLTNLGSAGHRKLKADQWQVLGTVHLPITLIKLWAVIGREDVHSSHCHSILEATMSLVSAVIVAMSHSIPAANAAEYHNHMVQYLDGIKHLFPNYRLHPNHHMALHLDQFLLLFGPVHGWWTFPFKWMIGAVQQMPHNGKPGMFSKYL